MTGSQSLSIGVIGTGGMGTRHVANLHRYAGAARVTAVYDASSERAEQAAAINGSTVVFDDPLALIHDAGVDAVLIASPDGTHAEYTLECLQAGKPVLCEKPLATRTADARKIVDAELALGKRLVSVGFMRRFDPQHVAVKQIIQSGKLGRAIVYKGTHRNAMIPDSVSGEVVITNSAGHDLDAARWLLGQEIERVYVRGVRSHERFSSDTTDVILMELEFSGHCLAAIEVFVAAEYGYEVIAEIVAERGTAATLSPDLALLRHQQNRAVSVPVDWLDRFQDAYVAEILAWVEALRGGKPFEGASTWDGYTALVASEACIRSLNSGLPETVELPAKPDLYR